MGLDMYAYTRNSSTPNQGMGSELKYWRKNNALHNWMYQLWCKKQGGMRDLDEFNCTAMELTREDILQLRSDIRASTLVPTAGFFWGALEYHEWQKRKILTSALGHWMKFRTVALLRTARIGNGKLVSKLLPE